MKTLTKDDVKLAFTELLDNEGTTTSLQVKNRLRDDGFWAIQKDVKSFLWEIADEDGVDWTQNGNHRIYGPKSNLVWPGGILPQSTYSFTAKKTKTPMTSSQREPLLQAESGCWVVTTNSIYSSELYFTGEITANQARYAYSLQLGIPYNETVVHRVK